MVNGVLRSKDDCSIIEDIDPVPPEILSRDPLDPDQLFECKCDAELFRNLGIRRFLKIGGLGLRNKDVPDLQFQSCF